MALVAEYTKRTVFFFCCFYLQYLCPPFQWKPHKPFPSLQELHHLYLLLLWFVVDVSRYFVYETMGYIVSHYGSLLVGILDEYPPKPFTFYLQPLWRHPLLSQFLQVIYDLEDNPPLDSLPFLLKKLKKPSSNMFY